MTASQDGQFTVIVTLARQGPRFIVVDVAEAPAPESAGQPEGPAPQPCERSEIYLG